MKALMFDAPWAMPFRDVPDPQARAGHAIVRVKAVGICGSDVHGFTGSTGRRSPGIIMGHEFAGQIESLDKTGSSETGLNETGPSGIISGVTNSVEPPINHLWTVPGESQLLEKWQAQDRELAGQSDVMTHYHQLQIEDFVQSILENRSPEVSAETAKSVVEVFAAIYKNHQ
jgi:predicted dehydrogenase